MIQETLLLQEVSTQSNNIAIFVLLVRNNALANNILVFVGAVVQLSTEYVHNFRGRSNQ